MASTSRVSFVEKGVKIDFLPVLIPTFMFGLPIIFLIGVFFVIFFFF